MTASHLAAVVDLDSRRHPGDLAVARRAQQPVLHITPEFLAALNCRDLPRELDREPPTQRHLSAV